MTFDFFEGAAGTGKTHNLVGRAAELLEDGVLGDSQKLLALTYINGARRRLDARLGERPTFRRRFECQTFDVFARILAARRRSLIAPAMRERAAAFNEFDAPCYLAATLLENTAVRRWVASSFPLVLVDEAQDLDEHRLRILQGLSSSCSIVAAADAFQCLEVGQDTAPLMHWLENVGQTHRLTQPRRTQQLGLLAAARAVREGRDIKAVLARSQQAQRPAWNAQGFRLVETFATNAGIVARTIADEISYRAGNVAILSPNMTHELVRNALAAVHSRTWTRAGQVFGPYPHVWDRRDIEEADALLADIPLPPSGTCTDLRAMLKPHAEHSAIAQAISRMDRLRRLQGQAEFSAAQVIEFVREAVRNRARLGFRRPGGRLAMTIHRAKNREFPNVIVLWPHSVTGRPEHLRRLLYNGITRAQNHCTVIVLGQGRVNGPPFAPANT
jgi:superfamily I DNA/RNA helicase